MGKSIHSKKYLRNQKAIAEKYQPYHDKRQQIAIDKMNENIPLQSAANLVGGKDFLAHLY